MRHITNPSFWQSYNKLPYNLQSLANSSFSKLKQNPYYPSPHLKRIGFCWSIRIGRKCRALGVEVESGILRFCVGTHDEYEKLITQP